MITSTKLQYAPLINEWMVDAIKGGASVDDAAGAVVGRLIQEGHADAVLRDCGQRLVKDI